MSAAEHRSGPPAAHADRQAEPVHSTPLEEIIRPAVERSGLVLEDVEITGSGERRVLRVVVDRQSGPDGVDLDAIAEAASAVSTALDEAGEDLPHLGRDPFQLEVTSPGVDRALTRPRHWARNRGRLVRVSVQGGDPILARIEEVEEDGVVLTPVRPGAKKGMPAKEGELVKHGFEALGPGVVQVESPHGVSRAEDGDTSNHGRQDGASDRAAESEAF